MSLSTAFETSTQPLAPPATRSLPLTRVAGFAGLAFALLVGLLNVFIGTLSPPMLDASGAEVVEFVAANKTGLAVAFGIVPAGIFLLFLFIASVFPYLSASNPTAAFWVRLGAVGIVLVEAMFLTRSISEVVLLSNIDQLANDHLLARVLWQLQAAAMTFNGLALAVVLVGLGRATRLAGLIPAWQEVMAFIGAIAFTLGAVGVIPALDGSFLGILGLPAFIIWIAWLAITSIRLLRLDPDAVTR